MWISIYFIINSFLAGAWWQYSDEPLNWKIVLETLCIFLLGVPGFIGLIIWDLIRGLHLKTWFAIYFTNKLDNITAMQAGRMKMSIGQHNKIWDKQVKIILKRNKYE